MWHLMWLCLLIRRSGSGWYFHLVVMVAPVVLGFLSTCCCLVVAFQPVSLHSRAPQLPTIVAKGDSTCAFPFKYHGYGGTFTCTCEEKSSLHLLRAQANERNTNHGDPDPWATAMLDYSAANEYIQAHYRDSIPWQQQTNDKSDGLYFQRDCVGNSSEHQAMEPIYNARELPLVGPETEMGECLDSDADVDADADGPTQIESKEKQRQTMLKQYGMTLIELDTGLESDITQKMVMDWRDVTQIKNNYLPELEAILPTLFSSKILMHCFWNPMLRGERHDISDRNNNTIPTASVASMVHIDTDIGAYESLYDLLRLIENNRIGKDADVDLDGTSFDMEEFANAIMDGKRFLIMNFWRSTNHVPVTSAPLAILSTRYDDYNDVAKDGTESISTSYRTRSLAFPNVRPDMDLSKWYVFPDMTHNEVLAFYQYDRLVTQPSDLWHCAISLDDKNTCISSHTGEIEIDHPSRVLSPPRESFDIRALIVLDEHVPQGLDRFHPGRIRPLLSFEESGCFCDEQASKRSQLARGGDDDM